MAAEQKFSKVGRYQYGIKMSKTFLEICSSITLWIEENTASHPLDLQ